MAVQAQYPSNILFLNNRNSQETKNNTVGNGDYCLRPQQPGADGGGGIGGHGVFFDQSQMFMNNNGNGGGAAGGGCGGLPRKRGRGEMTIAAATTTTATTVVDTNLYNNINPFGFSPQNQHQQHLRPQIIDLTQLQNHNNHQAPPNGVSTGLGLSFGEQQLQRHQQHNNNNNHHLVSSQSSFLPSILSDEFANQIKQQTDEINRYIQLQGEHLRRTLTEKRQRHCRALLDAAEETVARRLREKDTEVERAVRRNAELEARAAHLTAEAQVWQAKARAQEAQAASLQAQLQQAMMSSGGGTVCTTTQLQNREGVEGAADDAESAYVDPERINSGSGGPSCKACMRRVATVVLLPCRHLCVCAECNVVVQACPLCLSVRNASVDVYLS